MNGVIYGASEASAVGTAGVAVYLAPVHGEPGGVASKLYTTACSASAVSLARDG